MTAHPDFIGRIQVRPALNDAEQAYLLAVLDSDGTLRGTPTGRGDTDVPFAHLAWQVCADGCCLEWDPDLEDAVQMVASLRFLVDHLLRSGAKGEGRPRLGGFTFDHVATGAVLACDRGRRTAQLVTATDNGVWGREVPLPCDDEASWPRATKGADTSARRHPNVIEFRPRRA